MCITQVAHSQLWLKIKVASLSLYLSPCISHTIWDENQLHSMGAHTLLIRNVVPPCTQAATLDAGWMNLGLYGRIAVADWLVAFAFYGETGETVETRRHEAALEIGKKKPERGRSAVVWMVKALGTRKAINTQLPFPLCHVTVLTFLTIHSKLSLVPPFLHVWVRVWVWCGRRCNWQCVCAWKRCGHVVAIQ